MPTDPDLDFADNDCVDTDFADSEFTDVPVVDDTDPADEEYTDAEFADTTLAGGGEDTEEIDAADGEPCDLDADYEPLPERSVLDVLDNAFRWLCAGPSPLSVDGAALGHGLPERLIPVVELRDLLVGPRVSPAAQEAVWRFLVAAAQTDESAWVVAATGMALPGLRNIGKQLTRDYDGDGEEILAEVLAGFTERLKTLDPDAGTLFARLVWAAERAGAKRRAAEWRLRSRRLPLSASFDPPGPDQGHPDLVLAEAVRDGVLDEFEASLIGDNRLDGTRLADIARRLGCNYGRLRWQRDNAEYRLVHYLTEQKNKKIYGEQRQQAA